MSLLVHQTRFDLLGTLKDRRARFMGVAFPLLLLVILSSIAGDTTTTVNGARVPLKDFYLPGIVAMSILFASYGTLVATAVVQRETGVLKRRRATPVSAATLVAGRALATLVAAGAATAILLIVAQATFGVGVSGPALAGFALFVVVAVLAFSCLGYAVASVVRTVDGAQPAVQLTLLPLYFISGIWFPSDELPSALRHVAEWLPVEPLAHGLHAAALGQGVEAADLARLLLWAVVGLLVAARRFSWLPKGP